MGPQQATSSRATSPASGMRSTEGVPTQPAPADKRQAQLDAVAGWWGLDTLAPERFPSSDMARQAGVSYVRQSSSLLLHGPLPANKGFWPPRNPLVLWWPLLLLVGRKKHQHVVTATTQHAPRNRSPRDSPRGSKGVSASWGCWEQRQEQLCRPSITGWVSWSHLGRPVGTGVGGRGYTRCLAERCFKRQAGRTEGGHTAGPTKLLSLCTPCAATPWPPGKKPRADPALPCAPVPPDPPALCCHLVWQDAR